ncbi:MAG: serine hydrolase [Erythrobacter sp.]|nr:serine hydrolase [Erythrobacter sp.]NCQ63145.1 serine hydrolase [Alphaproteobacteria bacterium]
MFRYSLAAFAIAFAAPAIGQDAEAMDTYVASKTDDGTFMGAVLVAEGDDILLDKGYGMASLEWGIPNGGDVKYRIGSVTKQFTAAAIMLLEDQGKLTLDAPIATYLEDAPASWQTITVQNLLNHTSGIPNFTAEEDFLRFKMLPTTRDGIIETFRDAPLDFTPGSEYSYSNSGYILLSAIIENVSGQTYADFVQANIFDPLGMSGSGVADNTAIIARQASGYTPGEDGIGRAEYSNLDIPQGAGAIYSTPRDMLKWQRGLYGGKLLSPASLQTLVTPALDGYALGVMVRKNDTGTVYFHSGGIEGFNSWLAYDPDREISVVVLGNLNGRTPSEIGSALMDVAQGGELPVAVDRQVAETDPATLAQYEGNYVIAPSFAIRMFVENGKLMAQATGQSAAQLYAQEGEEDFFFLKVVDAQVRFNRDDSGDVTSLTLYQGGQEIPGMKE